MVVDSSLRDNLASLLEISDRWTILLINIILGRMLFGRGIAMIWAMRAINLDQGVASGS